jgi:outer membrane beta-barrel protein
MQGMSKKCLLLLIATYLCVISSFAGELDTYDFSWLDPDKEVYVLQNRKYRKAGKVHANIGYGMTTSGAFVDASSLQGRFGYFFQEELGFEVVYSKNSGSENDTASLVRNQPGGSGSKPFRRIVDSYMGGMILWAPFYSKINTFNTIIYVDWIFGLGYGKIDETNNKNEFESGFDTSETSESHSGILWNAGAKFFLTEMWSLRFDVTTMHYQATVPTKTTKDWYNNYDLALSFGFNY